MSQKIALITGANRGIGLSFSRHLSAQNYSVIGVCRHASDALKSCADEVIENIDIGDARSCNTLFSKLTHTHIDLLINNAGILRDEQLGHLNFETIEEQFRVNTLGTLRVMEILLPKLVVGAKIAIITSRMGSISDNTSGGRYGYRMSKAALNAAAKSLAIDLKPKNIAVGIFHPGFVTTDMTGGRGDIAPDEAATRITTLIDQLNISNSGTFWHSNGDVLPW